MSRPAKLLITLSKILLCSAIVATAAWLFNARATAATGSETLLFGGTPTPTCTPPVVQGFDDVSSLPGAGWVQINHSEPLGAGVWAQGNTSAYPSQSGNPDAYVTVGFESGSKVATLSNWLLTPLVRFQNGDSITFWSRTVTDPEFPDRLQVRLSTNGGSTNVGMSSTDVGDFTTLLLDINATYQVGGYPNFWTQYTATVTGVPSPTAGRFAFRYFVENGGPGGSNSDGIGVDTVTVNTCLAVPSISGTITYGNAIGAPATRYVSNATVTASGALMVTAITGPPGATAGQYSLSGFGGGSYTITPTKTTGANNITSFDAGRIAQHAAGPPLPQLAGNQLIVADVSGNGSISSFDAGEVAHYVAATEPIGLTGTWKFLPVSRNYASVTNVMTGQDYLGLLMGEVSGNWTNTGARVSSSGGDTSGPEREISVNAPSLRTSVNSELSVPILVDGVADKGIISYEFDLMYDPSVIQPMKQVVDISGTASRGLTAVANASTPGFLRVVMYGPIAIDTNGVLLNLRFTTVGAPGSSTPLTWQRMMFNEGDSKVVVTDGKIDLCAEISDRAD